jgi:hypothetical protein
MKTIKRFSTILVALFISFVCRAQPGQLPQPVFGMPPGQSPTAPAVARDPANYLIRVEWKDAKGDAKSLEVLTADGHFEFNGLQKNSVKINENDVPVTLKLDGNLNALGEDKARLYLYLNRTVPFVTGSNSSGVSSYTQMSAGLQSNFIVKFGKPVVIQSDENGTISVLVKRLAD